MRKTKMITTALIAAVFISACGASEPSKGTSPQNAEHSDVQDTAQSEQEETEENTSEQKVSVANPWRDCSQEEEKADSSNENIIDIKDFADVWTSDYGGDQRLLYSTDFDHYYIELSPEGGKIAKLTYVRCTGERE